MVVEERSGRSEGGCSRLHKAEECAGHGKLNELVQTYVSNLSTRPNA